MRILRLSPYFYPERISSSHLSEDLYEAFSKAGFISEMHAPSPTRGISEETRKKYSKIKHEKLYDGSVEVHRFSMLAEGRNPVLRALRYILVNIRQYIKGSRAKDIDIIFEGSTPPTQGVLCALVKRSLSKKYKKKVPFIFSLQDVFPDSLVNAGMTKKESLIWKLGRKIEDYTYKNADKIIVISEDIKKNIMAKGVTREKIAVIPHWIDTDEVVPVKRNENTLFDELNIPRDKFIITYAGNLGTAQGIDTLLNAAEILKENKDILFVIFGGGVNKEKIEKQTHPMDNVMLFPLQPQQRVSEVYSLGDLSAVACRKGVGGGAIPSKTYSIMAAAMPLLLSFDENTTLWNLVKENDLGYLAPSGDAESLATQIKTAFAEKDKLKKKGETARSLAESRFSKEKATQKYIELFLSTAKK